MENSTMTNLTQQEIEEGNKLIAEFEGMVYTNDDPKAYAQGYMFSKELGAITVADLQYHESWDWLMPMVDKIAEQGHAISISTGYGCIVTSNTGEHIHMTEKSYGCTTLIHATWLAVTSAIKFINSKNK